MVLQPLVIAVAPNGARKTKRDHPALPITSNELVLTARECLDAGASMIHLHVRDSAGRHSLDAETYRSTTAAIQREAGDRLVIQVTSEASGIYQPDEQIEQIKALRPEAVSIALREFLTDDSEPGVFADFLLWLSRERITAQYILFSEQDRILYQRLAVRGVIPASKHWMLYVIGRYETGFTSALDAMLPADKSEAGIPWAVCAFGGAEHINSARAITLGGHVRVGFENNLHLKGGTVAGSNSELVAQVVDVAQAVGRPVADAYLLREMFSRD